MVVDHLHKDKDALNACSLVARIWTKSARYHLFSDLYLQYRHGCDDCPSSNIELFLEKGQAVWSFVQALRVEVVDPDQCSTSSKCPDRSNTFQSIIRFLPGLHTLILTELEHVTHEFFGGDGTDFIYEPKASLRKLVMCNIPSSLDWIWRHLGAFSHVKELRILNGGELSSDSFAFDESNFPKLGALYVDFYSASPATQLMDIIPSPCIESSLEKLGVVFGGDDVIPRFRRLFVRVAPNLSHLRLDFADWDIPVTSNHSTGVSALHMLDLNSCTSLRSIHICFYGGMHNSLGVHDRYTQWNTVLQFLSQITSVLSINITLLHLLGDFDNTNSDDAIRPVWEQLDAKLASLQNLNSATFLRETRMLPLDWRPSFEPLSTLPADTQYFLRVNLPRFYDTGRMRFHKTIKAPNSKHSTPVFSLSPS